MTIVPTPSVVKISSSSWGTRPSMTCASGDAALDRPEAGLHLRDHARLEGGQQAGELVGGDLPQERVLVGPVLVEAFDVGEDDELLRAEGLRQSGGGGVGVEVVEDAVVVEGHSGDDGDASGVDQVVHGGGVHGGHVADAADVDLLAVHIGPAPLGGQRLGVLTGHADGEGAVVVDEPHQFPADLADQDHPDHVGGLGGGRARAAPCCCASARAPLRSAAASPRARRWAAVPPRARHQGRCQGCTRTWCRQARHPPVVWRWSPPVQPAEDGAAAALRAPASLAFAAAKKLSCVGAAATSAVIF